MRILMLLKNLWQRTGCCGCPISYKAVEDLEKIRPYEPNLVTAAWNVFGKSYEYRAKYNAYKEKKMRENREDPQVDGQISIWGERLTHGTTYEAF